MDFDLIREKIDLNYLKNREGLWNKDFKFIENISNILNNSKAEFKIIFNNFTKRSTTLGTI